MKAGVYCLLSVDPCIQGYLPTSPLFQRSHRLQFHLLRRSSPTSVCTQYALMAYMEIHLELISGRLPDLWLPPEQRQKNFYFQNDMFSAYHRFCFLTRWKFLLINRHPLFHRHQVYWLLPTFRSHHIIGTGYMVAFRIFSNCTLEFSFCTGEISEIPISHALNCVQVRGRFPKSQSHT